MPKIVILDGYTIVQDDMDWSGVEKMGECTVYDRTPQSEAIARIGDAEIVLTSKVLITREVFDACPNIRYIGVLATGYNVIDVAEAKKRGIEIGRAHV